jgi:HEAT repeat protein
MWQNTVAVHRLATFLGQYWDGISRGEVTDPRIIEPVYQCLPMMNEVERWMSGPGRDVLLATIADPGEDSLLPTTRVLGELREPRAISPLINYVNQTTALTSHSQALSLAAISDTLGRLGDRRASQPLQQFALRVVDIGRRSAAPKRRDNLPTGDPDIPGSIVYAAVMRACGLLGDRSALDLVLRAISDFDPYVRTQSIEALKRLDPVGDDTRSRIAAREALQDPRDSVVRAASQLVLQYRDLDATSSLRTVIETRPELAASAYDALRHLGQ